MNAPSIRANDAEDQRWEHYKKVICELYLIRGYNLEKVTEELNNTHDLDVTKAQVAYRFKKWGVRKNLSEKEWNTLIQRIRKRKQDGKETEVCINGLPMDERKVKKAVSRYGVLSASGSVVDVPSPHTPGGITIRTPPLALDILTPVTAATSFMCSRQVWADHKSILIESLPIMHFRRMIRTEETQRFGNVPMAENLMSITSAADLQAEIVAYFKIGSTWPNKSALFRYEIEALMPEKLYSTVSNPQLTLRGYGPRPYIKLINWIIFMVSNKMFCPTANISRTMYSWFGHRNAEGLLSYLLSLHSHTADAIKEHVFAVAIEHKDVCTVKAFLASGLDPNAIKCSHGWASISPLQRACKLRNLELVQTLVQAGARVNIASSKVPSPLTCAVGHLDDNGRPRDLVDLELVKILLNADASVNPRPDESPLMKAVAACHPELVDLLLAKGANPNYAKEDDGNTPLLEAIRSQGSVSDILSIVESLFQAGADVRTLSNYNSDCSTVLLSAVDTSCIELVLVLLNHGACPSEKVLNRAISRGQSGIVRLLLDSGARITPKVIEGAAREADAEMFRLLLDYADENIKEIGRSEAFTFAIQEGAKDLIENLSDSDAILRGGPRLEAAIEAATARGDLSVLHFLLDRNSRYRATAIISLGCSLSCAIANGRDELVEFLLEAGADPNAMDSVTQRTPLLEAIYRKDIRLSQKLLAVGASVNITIDDRGKTLSVLPAAVSWGHHLLIQEIIRAGADINAYGSGMDDAKSALTVAVEKGDSVLTRELIKSGADVNAPAAGYRGCTALVAAIRNGDLPMVDQLLTLGADPDESALIASILQSTELMQMLLSAKRSRCQRLPQGYGIRAMQHAIASSNIAAVAILLQERINPNAITRHCYGEISENVHKEVRGYGESPLGTAIRLDSSTNLDLIQMLLREANPNMIVSEANGVDILHTHTSLLAGIARKNFKAVEILVKARADVNSKTDARITRTPLQSAVEIGAMDIIKLLLKAGADVNAPPHHNQGATALQFAAMNGHVGTALLLLEHHADVNAPPAKIDGRTALEGASEHGRLDMVRLLVSAGAQVTGTGSEQYHTARDLATKNGHVTVRQLLESLHPQHEVGVGSWDIFTDSAIPADLSLDIGIETSLGSGFDDCVNV